MKQFIRKLFGFMNGDSADSVLEKLEKLSRSERRFWIYWGTHPEGKLKLMIIQILLGLLFCGIVIYEFLR